MPVLLLAPVRVSDVKPLCDRDAAAVPALPEDDVGVDYDHGSNTAARGSSLPVMNV